MAEEDVGLVFDPESFRKGFASIDKGMRGLQTSSEGIARGMSKAILKAEVAVRVLGAAFRAVVGVVNQQMPEIGTVFGVVKDIFFRNFFFPLRQAILPLLQRLLDWTRTHRALFVKWGQTAVAIFNVLATVVKAAWSLLERFWQGIRGAFLSLFGSQAKSFGDLVNLVIFKISVAVNAAMILLGPVIDAIAGLIRDILPGIGAVVGALAGLAWDAISNFIKGVASVGPAIKDAWKGIAGAFKNLADALNGIKGKSFDNFFQFLGKLAGLSFAAALQGATILINGLSALIDALTGNWNAFNKAIGDTEAALEKFFNNPFIKYNPFLQLPRLMYEGAKAAPGAVRTVSGAAAAVAAGTARTIGNVAGAVGGAVRNLTGDLNQTVNIYATVTEGNASAAGVALGRGFARQYKETYLEAKERAGRF